MRTGKKKFRHEKVKECKSKNRVKKKMRINQRSAQNAPNMMQNAKWMVLPQLQGKRVEMERKVNKQTGSLCLRHVGLLALEDTASAGLAARLLVLLSTGISATGAPSGRGSGRGCGLDLVVFVLVDPADTR